MIEQTRFLSTVFLRSESKLENIYSGVNSCGKNVCGSFYLRELIFPDHWKNRKHRKKLVLAKNSYLTVYQSDFGGKPESNSNLIPVKHCET